MVHRDGRIFNRHAHVMATDTDRYGYITVRLNRDGKQRHHKLHRIVCEAWRGPQPTAGHEVCHGNGVKADNRAENLRWGTRKENAADSLRHGSLRRPDTAGESHGCAKLTARQVSEMRSLSGKVSQRELAARFGVSQTQVCHILQGRKWRAL